MTAQSQTPQSDRLTAIATEREAITGFLEWLSSQQVVPHVWTTGLTTSHECTVKPSGRLLHEPCPRQGCERCNDTGWIEFPVADRYLPDRRSHDQLAMEYLGIDPVALEKERRAMLRSLQDGA